ncbi:hypothetical protein ACFRSX_03360 [Streptomyces goshikiensis]|uniref:hypothetical protein n=1 Tax=Streptomyces TaxID=1883 RepID=UPI000C27DDF2|nr:hypothetical protein [Streptomyces sp. CB02120-2]PJN18911.1 hypothetical protein CG724_08860 [Streptomyces sp. CB02120-2]
MDTYAYGYGNTGHYARPGTHTSYCGRELMHEPNTPIAARICKACAKAEQIDRVAAGEVAADRAIEGPTLAERAHVRYCLVGAGRRVHYSNNDDTLCGREVTEYDDGSALLKKGTELCAPCGKAAEHRAYARSLAAASPLAAAAVEVAEIVEAVDPRAFLRAAVLREGGEWNVERVTALYDAAGITVDRNTRWGFLLNLAEDEHLLTPFDKRGTFTAIPAAVEEATAFEATTRAVDAVEHAEGTGAQVETVAEAEALYAAALVTEAEADAGTWRGEWIGEQPAALTLFDVEQPAEQGALFTDAAPAEEPTAPVRVRVRFEPAAIERHVAKAAAERIAYRAEMDARKAAEAARYGTPDRAPARRVVEGVIVEHAGSSEGSAPSNATHPDVIAAREVLAGLAVARLTEHHDVSKPTAEEQAVRGYMVEPRGGRRVAVYWLEGGATIRRDTLLHGAALDCLAHRLNSRGWNTEPLRASSLCVFAWRPA